jgi:hypothetical protein
LSEARATELLALAELQFSQAQKALDAFSWLNLKDWATWGEIDVDLERGTLKRMRDEWLRQVMFLRIGLGLPPQLISSFGQQPKGCQTLIGKVPLPSANRTASERHLSGNQYKTATGRSWPVGARYSSRQRLLMPCCRHPALYGRS